MRFITQKFLCFAQNDAMRMFLSTFFVNSCSIINMYQSKFIEIVEKLTKSERHQFRKWTQSPIANAREDVAKLVEFVLSKRSITATTVNRKQAFEFIFPGKKFDEQLLRYTMSYATDCLEDFLSYFTWKQSIQPDIILTQTYNQRSLNVLATKQLSKTQALLEQSSLKDSQYYAQTFSLEVLRFDLMSKNKRYDDFNLQKISDSVHQYAVAEILRYACLAQSFKQVSGKATDFLLLDAIIELIKSKHFDEVPAIQVYYLLYKLTIEPNDNDFGHLYELVFKYESVFKENELKDIFILTINFCIKQLNTGKQLYAQRAFNLYLHALDKKYLLENGELSRFTFKNIAFIGVKRLQDFKRTAHFIDHYNIYVNEHFRENAIQFTKATLFYAQKQYPKAMRILQTVEFTDVLWNIDAKILIIKMLFELKEYDSILPQIKSLKMYVYRQKDIGYFKTIHQKTITFFALLYKNVQVSKAKKNNFKLSIETEKDLVEKEWLLQMLNI